MKSLSRKVLLAVSSLIVSVMSFSADAQQEQGNASKERRYVTIGTGGISGVYYPTGGAICRLVNRGRAKVHGIRCSVESTGGSIYNINALRTGELDIAFTQSDWQYHAYNGTSFFSPQGPDRNLRSLFSLHTEAFTIVVRNDSGIKKLEDLKNKRVNVGNPGSGTRATMQELMKYLGWTMKDFKLASELRASEQPHALCDNKIDVMIYSAGHPNGAVQEVSKLCGVRLINVEGAAVDKMIKDSPFYAMTTIPGGMYAGTPNDVKTFGIKATIISSSKVSDDVVYNVVKAVFDNFDDFKKLHPVFANLDKKRLIKEGNTAPLHNGALRYFKEKKLM